jgi:raffinose/stachyose/melibiose transport system permease protein
MLTKVRDTAPKTILLLLACLFAIFPLLSMLSAALAPQGTVPVGISFPTDPQWHNFVDAWNVANITTLLWSALILVLGVVPASLLFATMAGYALGGLRIPLATPFSLLLLLGLTLPFEAVLVPLYYQIQSMGLLNTRIGFILPMIGLNMPFAVYWMRIHFQSIPKEISESANIDGAGPWSNFRHIQIPLAIPAMASLTVLLFLSTWNQFMLAIVLIQDPDKRTMAGALQAFVGEHQTDVVLLNAGALLIMAPVIVVFVIFQRFFSKALLAGAVKG